MFGIADFGEINHKNKMGLVKLVLKIKSNILKIILKNGANVVEN